MVRRRTNTGWSAGSSRALGPALPSEFERVATELGLSEDSYESSRQLRAWCAENRHRCYIPERLLKAWGIRNSEA